MPHFHLHLRHGPDRVEDPNGAEYNSLMSARAQALVTARRIMGPRATPEKLTGAPRFEIADRGGEIWLVVPFLDAT